MDNDNRMIGEYEVVNSFVFNNCEHILGENMNNVEMPYMTCVGFQITSSEFSILDEIVTGKDYIEIFNVFLSRLSEEAKLITEERDKLGIAPLPLTIKDCIKDGLDKNIMKQVIILKPSNLAPEHRTPDYQIQIALDGLGCRPNSGNNAVYCINVLSGERRRYFKDDIAGVADIPRLPEIARYKIAELRSEQQQITRDGTFEYGGLHFKPYRKFEKRDMIPNPKPHRYKEPIVNMANMRSDSELGISKYDGRKAAYSHENFYQASGGSEYDIFSCLENGKLYVPCENELFQYTEPPEKKRGKDSILGQIEDGKKTVAHSTIEKKKRDLEL